MIGKVKKEVLRIWLRAFHMRIVSVSFLSEQAFLLALAFLWRVNLLNR